MSSNSMRLKAKIRNIAKEKQVPAQAILQNYMFERFLERLAKSDFSKYFILKGGILISAMIGIENRTTMDLDATIKHYPLTIESITKAFHNILAIEIKDDVKFVLKSIDPIRNEDIYGGFRVSVKAEYENILAFLQIDLSTGDMITPLEIVFNYQKLFNEDVIPIWAYPIETVLSEKVETILSRGEFNTRLRDFYDVYILTKSYNVDHSVFLKALRHTSEHRKTTFIFEDMESQITKLAKSETLKTQWIRYTKDYKYAKRIQYEEVISSLEALLQIDISSLSEIQ